MGFFQDFIQFNISLILAILDCYNQFFLIEIFLLYTWLTIFTCYYLNN